MLSELPLVIFTIIAQMSVGSFVVLGLIHLLAGRAGRRSADVIDRVSDPALYAIGPILVVGLLASMMHLGTPIRAINALRHVDSSWLSREILFGLLFAGLTFVATLFLREIPLKRDEFYKEQARSNSDGIGS